MQRPKHPFRCRLVHVIAPLLLLLSLPALCACSLQIVSDENSLRDEAYKEKCSELVKTYGPPAIKGEYTTRYMAGLGLVDLIDFDGDGADELIVAYADNKQTGSYDAPRAKVEIWSFDGRDVQLVFRGAPSLHGTNGYFPFIDVYSRIDEPGLAFLKQECHGSSPLIYSYELLGCRDDGSFGDIVEPALSLQDFGSCLGASKYRAYLFDANNADLETGMSLDQVVSHAKTMLSELGVDVSDSGKTIDSSAGRSADNDEITKAVYLDLDAIERDLKENPARAKLNWEGKVVKYSSTIDMITEDSVYLETGKGRSIRVSSLPLEMIAQLNKGDHVTVIGACLLPVEIDGYSIVKTSSN